MTVTWWKVTLNGKHIDDVPYSSDMDKEAVKQSLVNHDGYHPDIKLVKSLLRSSNR
jgi:hypothetical protein